MAPKKKAPVPAELVEDLHKAYQELNSTVGHASALLHVDKDLPVYVPKYGLSESDYSSAEARQEAIRSIGHLFIAKPDEIYYTAGLVCASADTVGAIGLLNDAKLKFKAAVKAIKDFSKERDLSGNQVAAFIHEGDELFRSRELKSAMDTVRISALDLWKCYAQIRVMPPRLTVFSWTWATTHSRIKKLSVADALKKVEVYFKDNEDKLALNTQLLASCSPDEELVEKVHLGNQLRANYAYLDGDATVRKSCPISGMVIVQGDTLPRYLWRDDPAKSDHPIKRLERESNIASEPLIKELDIYRYADAK